MLFFFFVVVVVVVVVVDAINETDHKDDVKEQIQSTTAFKTALNTHLFICCLHLFMQITSFDLLWCVCVCGCDVGDIWWCTVYALAFDCRCCLVVWGHCFLFFVVASYLYCASLNDRYFCFVFLYRYQS